ncbi:MAG: MFS transporter [Sphingobium sp.]|nr:MFS transporter [Sphingobium sp.]
MRDDADRQKLLSASYKRVLLATLLLASTVNFMDRAIVTVVVEPMRVELGFTDTQIGLLQGLAFGLIYSIATLPISRLAERLNRKKIIAVSTAIFSAMSALCGTVGNFWQMFLCRAGVGVGEAAFTPPAQALLADHYPAEKRASVIAIIALGAPIGYLLGSLVGGFIAQTWGWRMVFFLSAIPGAIAVVAVSLFLREPPRGLVDGIRPSQEAPPSFFEVLAHLWRKKSFRYMAAGGAIGLIGSYAVSQFSLPFMMRVHGLTLAEAGALFGVVGFLSVGAGNLLGGFGSDFLRRASPRWYCWLPAIGMGAASVLYVIGFLSPSFVILMAATMVGGMMVLLFYAPTYAVTQNMVTPRMRATAVGVLATVFGIVGAGLGPTLLGVVSDVFAHTAFDAGDYSAQCTSGKAVGDMSAVCAAAAASGLRSALASTGVMFAISAVLFMMASRTIEQDMNP